MIRSLVAISQLSVGKHWYWEVFGYQFHGQVLITTWFVFAVIGTLSITANRNLKEIPDDLQNLTEYVTEFIRDIANTQIGDSDYLEWVSFLGAIFLFIFVSNWSGALLPWHVLEIPSGELAAPTNDINTTVALALLTSTAYFYGGLSKKGFGYFNRYVSLLLFFFRLMFWKILRNLSL
jgi:F-type H+-transporting ATPase subunit a